MHPFMSPELAKLVGRELRQDAEHRRLIAAFGRLSASRAASTVPTRLRIRRFRDVVRHLPQSHPGMVGRQGVEP